MSLSKEELDAERAASAERKRKQSEKILADLPERKEARSRFMVFGRRPPRPLKDQIEEAGE